MSYILDALKKAEKDRDLGSVPRLETVHEDVPARRRVWPWLIAALLAVNAAVIYSVMRESAQDQDSDSATGEASVPSASPSETPSAEVASPTPASGQASPAMASVPAQGLAELEPPKPVAPPTTLSAPAPMAPAAKPVPVPVATPASIPAAKPLPVTPPSPSPAEPLPVEVTPPASSSVPLLRDMPADFRQSLPPITVDVHVYGDKPEHRFVLINMRKYREGERLAEGPVLESIIGDGVILNAQGRRFRLSR